MFEAALNWSILYAKLIVDLFLKMYCQKHKMQSKPNISEGKLRRIILYTRNGKVAKSRDLTGNRIIALKL